MGVPALPHAAAGFAARLGATLIALCYAVILVVVRAVPAGKAGPYRVPAGQEGWQGQVMCVGKLLGDGLACLQGPAYCAPCWGTAQAWYDSACSCVSFIAFTTHPLASMDRYALAPTASQSSTQGPVCSVQPCGTTARTFGFR